MSTMRLRRLERLERRQPRGKPWRDPDDAAMPLWAALEASADAESAGRPFSWLPHPPLSAEEEHQVELALKDSDRVAERLRAERRGA
jgi:hypothetical protein